MAEDLKKKALEISTKFPLNNWSPPMVEKKDCAGGDLPESQFDQEFMKALEKGEHLNTDW